VGEAACPADLLEKPLVRQTEVSVAPEQKSRKKFDFLQKIASG
jgi:hypothetical protein